MQLFRIFLLSCVLFCSSCDKAVDPVEEKPVVKNHADAGEDQVSYVGSYALLDPSKTVLNGESISDYEWIKNQNNPEQLIIVTAEKITQTTPVVFGKEGIYRFILQVSCKSGTVFLDSMKVTVKPRQMGVVEDTCLEISIRECLKYKEGALTADKLLLLDTLSTLFHTVGEKVKSLKGIENCTNLVSLYAGLEGLTDLSPLANLTKLEYLSLTQNRTIRDISPLSNLINLRSLDIDSNPIQDLSALGNMTKLTFLNASYIQAGDLSPLSRLVNMEDLTLDGATKSGITIKSLEPLRIMTKLKLLGLAGTGITDLTPLENLTELIYITLAYNNITSITPLVKMKKLIRLIVRDNKLTDLKGLKSLESLDYLDAMNNQIKDISDLQYVTKIHLIGLTSNKIEDLLPIVNNTNLAQGVYLYVDKNPLSEKSLNEYIPSLVNRGVRVYK